MKTTIISTLLIMVTVLGKAQDLSSRVMQLELKSKEGYNPETSNLLKQELKNADIVLLGEPFHSSTFYPIKIELVKFLHEQLGYEVIAFESGLFQMEKVSEDIKNGDDVSVSFERGLFPIWTSTDEFQQLYQYLDSLKKVGSPMLITGFDCQVSSTNASKRFVSELEESAKRKGVKIEGQGLQILQAQFENLETGKNGLTDNFNDESLRELWKLEKSIASTPSLSMLHQSLLGFIGHFADLYKNDILKKLRNGTYDFKDNNVRDSLMAMQMLYIYRQLYPGKKIIGWGANLHFANQPQKIETDHPAIDYKPMGYYLKKVLGEKVYSLAVTTNNNIPNTIEWDLGEKNIELALLSRKMLGESAFSSCSMSELIGKADWSKVVDGMLYFNSSPFIERNGSNESYFIAGKLLNARSQQPVSFASIAIDGTTQGTASEINGEFFLKIDRIHLSKNLKISCIGYKSKYISISRLLKEKSPFKITLIPEIALLDQVVINGKAPDAKEIIMEAMLRIQDNYVQKPFNMEFYSEINIMDTVNNKKFILESIFSAYSEGYSIGSKKNYRVTQKREGGNYFMKGNTQGLGQWPVVEIAYNDIFSNQLKQQIFSNSEWDKINLKLEGIKLYDSDTVFVITYDYIVHGEIYILAKDFAIVKHVTIEGRRNFKNRMELIYRKEGNKYFPYVANGDYLHETKVDGKRKFIKISNRVKLKSFELIDVVPFEQNYEMWHPKNTNYDKSYWDANYPVKD